MIKKQFWLGVSFGILSLLALSVMASGVNVGYWIDNINNPRQVVPQVYVEKELLTNNRINTGRTVSNFPSITGVQETPTHFIFNVTTEEEAYGLERFFLEVQREQLREDIVKVQDESIIKMRAGNGDIVKCSVSFIGGRYNFNCARQ